MVYATTKMSSKGQVVIPEEIRNKLNLKPGTQFAIVGDDDVVILKTISFPSTQEFSKLIKNAEKQANSSGVSENDVLKIIKEVRKQKRNESSG